MSVDGGPGIFFETVSEKDTFDDTKEYFHDLFGGGWITCLILRSHFIISVRQTGLFLGALVESCTVCI